MTNLLQSGQTWLANQLKIHASSEVTYQRGANQVQLQAIVGRTLLKLEDGYGGVHMEWTDRDFLIATSDLILAGSPILPERGDIIREAENGTTYLYEVMAPGNEPPWRWSDPHRQLFRIHTKQIGTV
jgi:hypothetical protein